jgi:hypothetical protein
MADMQTTTKEQQDHIIRRIVGSNVFTTKKSRGTALIGASIALEALGYETPAFWRINFISGRTDRIYAEGQPEKD